MVLRLDQGAALLVLLGVELGILHHLLDLGVAETARGLDADGLLLAGRLVLGADVDDAVGVDVEGRSEEHTSELQSLMRISYAVFCLKKKKIIYLITAVNSKTHYNSTLQVRYTHSNTMLHIDII